MTSTDVMTNREKAEEIFHSIAHGVESLITTIEKALDEKDAEKWRKDRRAKVRK